jgi:gliding motility-associated-like protein
MKSISAITLGLFITLISFSTEVKATHLTGGEITWECNANGQVRFTLVIYRDCTGINAPLTPQTLQNNASVSIVCSPLPANFPNPVYINPRCGSAPCGSVPSGTIGAMEMHRYRSPWVTLPASAPPPAGWTFSWSSCCRPSTANLTGQPAYYLSATMYPYTPPGAGAALAANPCYDSSPDFLESPLVSVCTNKPSEYQAIGYDSDLDSLWYDWTSSKVAAGQSAQYQTGYSATNPLPSTGGSTPAVLDNRTGRITFQSNVIGQFSVATKIQEYRCGQLIGEIIRDLIIVTDACPPPSPSPTNPCATAPTTVPNNAPTLNFQWVPGFDTLTPAFNANNVLTHYELEVYAGTEIKFRINSNDNNTQPNCLPQLIEFKAQGGNLSNANTTPPWSSTTACLFQQPCATLTSLNVPPNFISSLSNLVEFNWQTTCDHLTYQATQCGQLSNTYDFYFRFEDNGCPLPAFSYATVKIKVLNDPSLTPDLSNSCISIDQNTGDLSFDWVPRDTGMINFDYYLIYRSNNGSPFAAIDTIADYSVTNYTDIAAPAGINQYYMRAAGGCSLISEPSDTIQNISITLNPLPPPPNSSIADLSWNPKNPSGPNGEHYQIWREICGSGNWELVDSTQSTTYSDTVNICGECLNYQIRIQNSCFSDIDSGFFADQSNTDIIVIDSLTVRNGLANIAWDTTNTSSDVVEYVILQVDANGSWVPVASVPIGTPMPFQIATSNAGSEREIYKIVTLDSCGNQSSDLNTTAHNTIFASVNSDPCDAFVRVRWNSYKQWTQTDVEKYELFADITDNLGNTTNGVLVFQGTPNDTVHDQTNVISGYQYCYYVRATDSTGAYTSTSNRVCVTSQVVKKSRLLYMGRATVKTDGSIQVYGYLDPDADVIDYGVERADGRNGPWFILGRIPKPSGGPWELKYSDYSATPESNQYFYRFSSIDSCGNLDTISNIGRNILIQARSNGNLTNTLVWNPYEEFGGIVERYELYRMVDNNGAWSLVTQLSGADTMFVDDIRSLNSSSGAFCYYVRAVEGNNPLGFLDEFGLPFSSESNRVCITQDARIFIPSAFNPESTVPENRVWKPSNVFASENSYELIIINRWGDKVFQTTNINEGWDGNYQGEPQALGVFTYVLKYRSLEGLPIEERGTFTLYRNDSSQ